MEEVSNGPILPCNVKVADEMLSDAISILQQMGAAIAQVEAEDWRTYTIRFLHREVGGDLSLECTREGASLRWQLVCASSTDTAGRE